MRYQVPQFVDIEDKIIGPFTLKQFLIYLVAALLLIPVYLFSDLSLFITVAIPVAGIAALFAHLKFSGKSLAVTLGNASQFTLRGQLFIWRRTPKRKPLPVRSPAFTAETTLTLADHLRTVTSSGRIVNEDIEDPFTDEETST